LGFGRLYNPLRDLNHDVLRSGHDHSRKQCVSTREKIRAGFRIGTSLVLLRISSCFSWIA
jgi:hypothetical protein